MEEHRISEFEATVVNVIRETADATTLWLSLGNARPDYKPGQFLTIDPHQFECLERFTAYLEDLKGKKEPPRAYSMSSAPHEPCIAITVKEERYISGTTKYPPLLSPLLARRTPRGSRLVVRGFTGPYTLSSRILSSTDHVVHICAGSGSVPSFSIIKHALEFHSELRHTFIYSNRSWSDVIFRDELHTLAGLYRDRLRVFHTLTREADVSAFGVNVRSGRLRQDLLKDFVPDAGDCHFFVCGPALSTWDRRAMRENNIKLQPRFMESVLADLAALGVRKDQITSESYG
jgi:3-ketosteroid 9alpha-monooxygenase subunit B